MKYNVEFKGFEQGQDSGPEKGIRKLIDEEVKRVDKRLKKLPPDEIFLRVLVDENSPHRLYHLTITLELPEKTLVAKKEQRPVEAAIRESFAEIERQLDEYKAVRRGEPEWKRLVRREEIRQRKLKTTADQPDDRQGFFKLVQPHLDQLKHFANHVVAYAEARGDLVKGEMTHDELVDTTLIHAYWEFLKEPARGEIENWLIQLAAKQLENEIRRSQSGREHVVYTEEPVPETPPAEEASTLGDEILDFYQPDQALKLEDVIPDLQVLTPEQETEREELRQCVRSALGVLPKLWRRVLLLRYVDSLDGAALARTVGREKPDVDRILTYAREYLRERLVESGCSVKNSA